MDLQKHPFVGIFEHAYLNINLKWPSLMYVVKYLDAKDSFWQRSDEEIAQEFLTNLSKVFDCNLGDSRLWWRIHRAEYSTPVFVPDYDKYKPGVRSPIEGLYIGGISRTYPRDRYMGTAFQTGLEAAQAVAVDHRT
jgi:protoporphyrinogen oxidase